MIPFDVSICIPSYNGIGRLEHVIRSVFECTNPAINYQVIFCDDGSKKEHRANANAIYTHYAPKGCIKYIQHDMNKGITRSWNELVKEANSEYIVMLNDDILVVQNWLDAGLYFMQQNANAGMIGFPTWFMRRDDMPNYFLNNYYIPPRKGDGARTKMTTAEIEETLRVEHYDKVPGRCACPVGCCFMFRKSDWSRIVYKDGSIGFPEWLKSLYEDFSFAYEMMVLGKKNYMLRYPRLYHCLGNTFCSNPELKCYDQLMESRKKFIEYYGGDEHEILDKYYEAQKKHQTKEILKYRGDGLKPIEKEEED